MNSTALASRDTAKLFYIMMGFHRWLKHITIFTLSTACRTIGKFNPDQALNEPSEMSCAKFEKRRGFLSWMSSLSSE
jgi:hypothetical protein